MTQLGLFYTEAIIENFGRDFNNLYGPAYKGIPLAVTTAIALSGKHRHNVSVTYNRKEAKDHGEKGSLIAHQYDGSEKVVIIEDVITAGTSFRESINILAANKNPKIIGAIISVDRMERGQANLSAIQEIKQNYDLPVFSLVTIKDIIQYLHNRPLDGKIYLNDDMKSRVQEYLAKYNPESTK